MAIGIFFISLYLLWVVIEIMSNIKYNRKGYVMQKRIKTTLLAIVAPLLSGIIAVSCSGEKKSDVKELSFAEQMNIKYAHVTAHNDSIASMWKEVRETSVSLDSVLNSPYEPDSSKLIAIKYPDDYFETFEDAFAKARKDLGPDKGFVWIGKFYSTNYKEEGYPPWAYRSKMSIKK